MAILKFSVLIILFVCIHAQKLNGQNLEVSFQIKGLENKTIVTGYYEGCKQFLKDTLKLNEKGKASWIKDGHVTEGLYFVILPGSRYFDLLIGANQKFEVVSDTTNLEGTMSIIPECESSLYLNYQKTARHLQNDYDKLTRKLKMELTDSIKSIRQQIQMVNQYLEKFKEEMINLHPGSLTANIMKLIKNPAVPAKSGELNSEMLREQYQKIIKNFPSSIDFTDARLIFTPFLCPKLDSYFNHLLLQKNDSIIPAIKELMSRASLHKEYYEFFRRWLLENYSQRRFPGSEKCYVFLAEEYYINNQGGKTDSVFFNKLQVKVTRTKAIIPGATPMSLDLPDTSGNIFSFMAIKQKDIILFIYDSDCSPCKYVKSEIKALLNRLDSRNIAVYAVDVNDNHSDWMNFIKTTGPEWIHVNGYAKKQELSSEYMLDFLPGLTLIGPDKKIIAANLSFPDVEKMLRSKYSFSGKDR